LLVFGDEFKVKSNRFAHLYAKLCTRVCSWRCGQKFRLINTTRPSFCLCSYGL